MNTITKKMKKTINLYKDSNELLTLNMFKFNKHEKKIFVQVLLNNNIYTGAFVVNNFIPYMIDNGAVEDEIEHAKILSQENNFNDRLLNCGGLEVGNLTAWQFNEYLIDSIECDLSAYDNTINE